MTLPICVDLTVSESVQQFNVTVSENSIPVQVGIDTQIVAGTFDEYEGPYSVTPSEQVQMLATDGLLMTDDVTVSAMPSAIVSASTNVTVNPTLSVNYDTGEITASVSKTQSVNVVTEAGYAPVTSHEVVMSGNVATQLITHDSDDLTVSGNTVTAPEGYYPNSASKSIPDAVASQVTMSVSPQTPTVNSSGLVTASVGTTQGEIAPFTSEGYVGTNYKIQYKRTGGSKTLQLDTQAAATITPTESEQTAVASGKYTTGAVKVGAISSDYVGSGVTRNDSSDLSVSGATVTVPAGYYESNASASVQSATWKSASTIGVVPSISVDANGLITATASGWTSCKPLSASGYADADTSANLQLAGSKTSQLDTLGSATYTPAKGSPTIITSGKYLTGDQTISAIPDTWYDMSGSMAWLGADATLVHEITPITVALKDTDFNTWTPSTTAATVVASQTLSGSTQKYVATDLLLDGGYNYINIWCMKLPVVYTGSPTNKALTLFSCGLLVQAMFRRYSSYTNLLDGNMNNNVTAQTTLATFERYYNSSGSLTYTNAASYGFYFANVAPTISSTTAQSPTITLKTPTMSARCSTTYLSTANCGLVDKTNTKLTYTCKVYRVRQDAYLQGFYRYLAARVAEMDS